MTNPDKAKGSKLKPYWPHLDWKGALAAYRDLHDQQGGLCAICKKPEAKFEKKANRVRELSVDHDHETKVVRGLLCNKCNRAIGILGDTAEGVQAALDYLKRDPPTLRKP